MASIGSSHEGRSIWCLTLTNYATGEPLTKPAFYVDANIHATELSGSVAALKLIDTVLVAMASATTSPPARQPYALRHPARQPGRCGVGHG